jgi:hypothetical protein
MSQEPTREMLAYAARHNLRYNSLGRGGWVFESNRGAPFSMHYSEIEAAMLEENASNEIELPAERLAILDS